MRMIMLGKMTIMLMHADTDTENAVDAEKAKIATWARARDRRSITLSTCAAGSAPVHRLHRITKSKE